MTRASAGAREGVRVGQGEPLGVIAGEGRLPALAVQVHEATGGEVVCFGFRGLRTSPAYDARVAPENRLVLGALASLRERLRACGVKRLLVVGRFAPEWSTGAEGDSPASSPSVRGAPIASESVAPPILPDAEALALLSGRDLADGPGLMGAVADWLTQNDFVLVAQDAALGALLAPEGTISRRAPPRGAADVVLAALDALASAPSDSLAQSALVAAGSEVMLESRAGTDALIGRAAERSDLDHVLVKATRLGQDRRLDLPAIGPETIEALARAGVRGLALEAGSVLVIDRARVVEAADAFDIAVWGFAARAVGRGADAGEVAGSVGA